MENKRNLAGRLKSVLALLLVFGPAFLLVFIATRGCEHKFKVLEDYGAVKNSKFKIYSKGKLIPADFSNFKGNILLVTTIQKTCPSDCAVSMWHIDQMLFQHIRKNKRKKLKQVQIISFATDGKGNPLPINELETIRQSLIDNVEDYDPTLWMIASGDAKKVFDFEFNGQKLLRQGKEFYGGESYQELILLLDKKSHLRMVLHGNQEGLVRRMREHVALLQKQYDKERKGSKENNKPTKNRDLENYLNDETESSSFIMKIIKKQISAPMDSATAAKCLDKLIPNTSMLKKLVNDEFSSSEQGKKVVLMSFALSANGLDLLRKSEDSLTKTQFLEYKKLEAEFNQMLPELEPFIKK